MIVYSETVLWPYLMAASGKDESYHHLDLSVFWFRLLGTNNPVAGQTKPRPDIWSFVLLTIAVPAPLTPRCRWRPLTTISHRISAA